MKNIKYLFMFLSLTALTTFNSCKEDNPTPTPQTGQNCVLKTTTDQDGDKVNYTFDGGKLVQVEEKYQSGSTIYNYVYTSGKLTEITSGTESYKITYTGSVVSRVDVYDGADLYEYYKVSFDGSGKLKKVEGYYLDDTDEVLFESYTYTYSGDNVATIVNTIDTDDDGSLDTDITTTISGYDDKVNPYYGLPVYLTEFDNPMHLSKNNPTGGKINVLTDETIFTISYTYNANKLPVSMTSKMGSSSFTQENTYDCK